MRKQLTDLREKMKEAGVNAYIVPTADFHASEYVGDYFKCREYVSGFTGSAGTLVVLEEEAGLWTDGRYFLQAAAQLSGSGIDLMKMDMPGVPKMLDYLREKLPEGGCIGFDGRVVDAGLGEDLEKIAGEKNGKVLYVRDLCGEIWPDRPPMSAEPIHLLQPSYTGKETGEKLAELKAEMGKRGDDAHLLTSLDDIAWLFNLRGSDVDYNPVAMAYALICQEKTLIYLSPDALNPAAAEKFREDGVTVKSYFDIYEDIRHLPDGTRLLLDEQRVNYQLVKSLPEGVKKVNGVNPTTLWKAVKTSEEQAWAMEVHVQDGVALTRFIYWLKKQMKEPEGLSITEISAADKLEEFRRQQVGYLGPSFDTIAGYQAHGAIIHYKATPETDVPLKPEGLLLVDSGGQYMGGTTDVTRTIVLGPLSHEQKKAFTLVLAGMLRLGNARFPEGTTGANLDVLARYPLWQRHLDYRHGTGHGVGSFLNVHEGPNQVRLKDSNARYHWSFVPGMITSDEPGYYQDGDFGIRHENLMLCVGDGSSEYGSFCKFEFLTLAPIDLEGVDPKYLSEDDVKLLNEYHCRVWQQIGPKLSEEERDWLRTATRPLVKPKVRPDEE